MVEDLVERELTDSKLSLDNVCKLGIECIQTNNLSYYSIY